MFVCVVPLSQPSSRDLVYPLWDVPHLRKKSIKKSNVISEIAYLLRQVGIVGPQDPTPTPIPLANIKLMWWRRQSSRWKYIHCTLKRKSRKKLSNDGWMGSYIGEIFKNHPKYSISKIERKMSKAPKSGQLQLADRNFGPMVSANWSVDCNQENITFPWEWVF